jgi:hypothetical protein
MDGFTIPPRGHFFRESKANGCNTQQCNETHDEDENVVSGRIVRKRTVVIGHQNQAVMDRARKKIQKARIKAMLTSTSFGPAVVNKQTQIYTAKSRICTQSARFMRADTPWHRQVR